MEGSEILMKIVDVPFREFVLNVSDGRKLPVFGRDFIMISPNGRYIDLFQPDSDHDIVATSAIMGITYVDEMKKTAANEAAAA